MPQLTAEVEAVAVGEPYVEDDELRRVVAGEGDAAAARGLPVDLVALGPDTLDEGLAHRRVVFDHEDGLGAISHGRNRSTACGRPRRRRRGRPDVRASCHWVERLRARRGRRRRSRRLRLTVAGPAVAVLVPVLAAVAEALAALAHAGRHHALAALAGAIPLSPQSPWLGPAPSPSRNMPGPSWPRPSRPSPIVVPTAVPARNRMTAAATAPVITAQRRRYQAWRGGVPAPAGAAAAGAAAAASVDAAAIAAVGASSASPAVPVAVSPEVSPEVSPKVPPVVPPAAPASGSTPAGGIAPGSSFVGSAMVHLSVKLTFQRSAGDVPASWQRLCPTQVASSPALRTTGP